MSGEINEPSVREQRVNEAIAAYLEAVDAGEAPDPKEFIAAHSDIAADLESFFANRDDFERIAEPLQPAGAAAAKAQLDDMTLPPAGEPTEAATLGPTETAGAAIGTRVRYFGDLQLLEEIACGGMGVVYKARQVSLNRIVALKMILAGQLASEEDVRRFHAEAEAAANLDHPGIVPIYEVGQHEEQHYFSMGYVEGSSLAAKIADGPLPPREAAEYTRKVAEAVAFAHEKGVIHRDLKPANVLLDKKGEPKVTDFGLAKKVEGDSGLTATGQILGTPAYMPPEQASGKIDEVTETADIYSLGAILYCLLTARPPFQADNPLDTLLQVLEREPVSPRQLNPNVPQDLETICLKCLEKDRHRRYASAQDVVDELQRFANGEPILAPPISGPARAWRWCRRKPVLATMTAALVLVFLSGFAGVMSQWIRAEGERVRAESERTRAEKHAANEAEARTRADEARTKADREAERANLAAAAERVAREEFRRQLYVAHINLAQQAYEFHNRPVVLGLLNRHRPSPDQEDLRGFEWYYLWRQCHRFRTVQDRSGTLDLNQYTRHDGSLSWYDITGKITFDIVDDGVDYIVSAAFSPDGKTVAVAYGTQNTLKVWDVQTGALKATCNGHTGHVISLAFSPDGEAMASGSQDKTVRVWNAATGELKATVEHGDEARFVWFSPDGKHLACGGWPGLKLWDVTTSTAKAELDGSYSPETGVTLGGPHATALCGVFSPDGDLFAAGWRSTKVVDRVAQQVAIVRLWKVASGTHDKTFEAGTDAVRSLCFSPDGKTLAGGTETAFLLWDVSTGTRRAEQEIECGGAVVRFSPDGTRLATTTGAAVEIFDVATGDLRATLLGHDEPVNALAFSPDGTALASAAERERKVALWDMAVAEPKESFFKHDAGSGYAASRDGLKVAAGGYDSIKIWDTSSGASVVLPLRAGFSRVHSLAFSPDGASLAGLDYVGKQLLLYQISSTQLKASPLQGMPNTTTNSLAYSPDGKTLAFALRVRGKDVIALWDIANGTIKEELAGHSGPVMALAFSPQGDDLASADNTGSVRLWDPVDGTPKSVLQQQGSSVVSCLGFSPSGKLLAVGCDRSIRVWHVQDRSMAAELTGHADTINSVAFSPVCSTLASASSDGTIKLWDSVTAEPKVTLTHKEGGVTSVAFSPEGKLLVSGGADGTVRLWRAATDEEVQADKQER